MRAALVGLGSMGQNHYRTIKNNRDIDFVAVVEPNDELVADIDVKRYRNVEQLLANEQLDLSASTDLNTSVKDSDYVVISTPTDYNEKTNFFVTSSVRDIISSVIKTEPKACIIIKSTIPVGFIDDVRAYFETDGIIYSPEFLREGQALKDNLYPSRIVVGEKSERAKVFARLLADGAIKRDINLFTSV